MNGDVAVHLLRKGALRSPTLEPPWDDPRAALGPLKRASLLANPLSRDDSDPVQLLGTREGRVVGRLDLVAGEAYVDGARTPILWTSALSVEKEARGSLLGVSLILRMQRLAPTCMACGVSQRALPVFRNLKWRDFELQRWMRVRRSRTVVEKYAGAGLASRAASIPLDAALAAHGALLSGLTWAQTRAYRAERAPQMPAELDERIEATARSEGKPAYFHRSAAWVNWVLGAPWDDDPRSRRELYLVRGPRGEVAAYFILRVRFFATASAREFKNVLLGSVQDWMSLDPALSELDLLLLAARALDGLGVDAIELCSDDPRSNRILPRLGFFPVGSLHILRRSAKGGPLDAPRFAQQSAWRLRPAEGDNSF